MGFVYRLYRDFVYGEFCKLLWVLQGFTGKKAHQAARRYALTYRVSGGGGKPVGCMVGKQEQAGYLILKTNNYYGTKEKKRCY
jgi:hypothetical protein